jgi:hypothetical protein
VEKVYNQKKKIDKNYVELDLFLYLMTTIYYTVYFNLWSYNNLHKYENSTLFHVFIHNFVAPINLKKVIVLYNQTKNKYQKYVTV